MEDNEFEEVTIISHTDRPQRVFSEKSIEKLKDQVSLEIVKEINGTEDKTYSDDPRLAPGLRELEKLKQDHFGEGEGKIAANSWIFFISRVAGESGQYLLGATSSFIVSNGEECKQIQGLVQVPSFIQAWGKYFLIFQLMGRITVLDRNFQQVHIETEVARTKLSRHVVCTKEHLYFKASNVSQIICLDRDLNKCEIPYLIDVEDFFVCPKTETITTLQSRKTSTKDYFIQRGDKEQTLKGREPTSKFTILKKMYSDHFLVGENDLGFQIPNILHLVDGRSLQVLHSCSCPVQTDKVSLQTKNIRLLAPRQGISCFLVLMDFALELFCEYRLKLYHLKTLELKQPVYCISHQIGDLWMLGTSGCTILSVRVDFSKCPALQL